MSVSANQKVVCAEILGAEDEHSNRSSPLSSPCSSRSGTPTSRDSEEEAEVCLAAAAAAPEQYHLQRRRRHEVALGAAHEQSQAVTWSILDRFTSLIMPLLLLATLPHCWSGSPVQLAATTAELAVLLAPGVVSWLYPAWHLQWRNHVVAACRTASMFLLAYATPPVMPTTNAWAGWLKFVTLNRMLSLNLFAWSNRLPLMWFTPVHLLALVPAAAVCRKTVCQAPAFCGSSAERHMERMASAVRSLCLFAPIPSLPPTLTEALPSSTPEEDTQQGCSSAGMVLCNSLALWLLVCFGFAFPLVCQCLSQLASAQAFAKRHCRRRHCPSCARLAAHSLPLMAAGAAALFLEFLGTSWQLIDAMWVSALQ